MSFWKRTLNIEREDEVGSEDVASDDHEETEVPSKRTEVHPESPKPVGPPPTSIAKSHTSPIPAGRPHPLLSPKRTPTFSPFVTAMPNIFNPNAKKETLPDDQKESLSPPFLGKDTIQDSPAPAGQNTNVDEAMEAKQSPEHQKEEDSDGDESMEPPLASDIGDDWGEHDGLDKVLDAGEGDPAMTPSSTDRSKAAGTDEGDESFHTPVTVDRKALEKVSDSTLDDTQYFSSVNTRVETSSEMEQIDEGHTNESEEHDDSTSSSLNGIANYGIDESPADNMQHTEDVDSPTLPPGWVKLIDPSSGDPYYLNEVENVTTWDRPVGHEHLNADAEGHANSEEEFQVKADDEDDGWSDFEEEDIDGLAQESASKEVTEGSEPLSPLPPGWVKLIDEASGDPYFFNEAEDITTWDRPTGTDVDGGALVESDDAEEATDEPNERSRDGNSEKQPSAGSPGQESIPAGWAQMIDPSSGDPYYFNEELNTTTWDRPTDGMATEDEKMRSVEKNSEYIEEKPKIEAQGGATDEVASSDNDDGGWSDFDEPVEDRLAPAELDPNNDPRRSSGSERSGDDDLAPEDAPEDFAEEALSSQMSSSWVHMSGRTSEVVAESHLSLKGSEAPDEHVGASAEPDGEPEPIADGTGPSETEVDELGEAEHHNEQRDLDVTAEDAPDGDADDRHILNDEGRSGPVEDQQLCSENDSLIPTTAHKTDSVPKGDSDDSDEDIFLEARQHEDDEVEEEETTQISAPTVDDNTAGEPSEVPEAESYNPLEESAAMTDTEHVADTGDDPTGRDKVEDEDSEKVNRSKEEDSGPLPDGWKELIDPSSGAPYYFNEAQNLTTWEKPECINENRSSPELPSGWRELVDPSSGRSYFLNEVDNSTTWERPTVGELVEGAVSEEPSGDKAKTTSEGSATALADEQHGKGDPAADSSEKDDNDDGWSDFEEIDAEEETDKRPLEKSNVDNEASQEKDNTQKPRTPETIDPTAPETETDGEVTTDRGLAPLNIGEIERDAVEASQGLETPDSILFSPRFHFLSSVPTELQKLQEQSSRRRDDFHSQIHDVECRLASVTARLAGESMDRDLVTKDWLDSSVFHPLERVADRMFVAMGKDLSASSLSSSSSEAKPCLADLDRRILKLHTNVTRHVHMTLFDAKSKSLDSLHPVIEHDLGPSLRDENSKATKEEGAVVKQFESIAGTLMKQYQETRADRHAGLQLMQQKLAEAMDSGNEQQGAEFLAELQNLRRELQEERVERKKQDQRVLDQIVQTTAAMKRALLETVGEPSENRK